MENLDLYLWLALALCPVLLIGAFIAYGRTAFKEGGWKKVRTALLIAVAAIVFEIVASLVKHAIIGD